jgi:hypothetical protein
MSVLNIQFHLRFTSMKPYVMLQPMMNNDSNPHYADILKAILTHRKMRFTLLYNMIFSVGVMSPKAGRTLI